jgi:ABC-type transport system involved in multi-copper enzyme maturation permease subunit
MTTPAAVFAGRWLVRETFRQALANGIFWLMLAITALGTAACLSAEVAGAGGSAAELTLVGGAVAVPLDRGLDAAVRLLELELAAWVAAAAGLLLALIWTAGFLPAFLEPGSAAVLLAKPVPRWCLLAAKYLGVVVFVGGQLVVFVLGTWLALGVRTGVWDVAYLECIPLLIVQFAVFFSFSTLLAVSTRSTAACVFGSIIFWLLCWGVNLGRHAVVLMPEFRDMSALFRAVTDAAYWLLPKPADLGLVLQEMLHADPSFGSLLKTRALEEAGAFRPGLSLLSSLGFAGGMLAVSARQLETTEY